MAIAHSALFGSVQNGSGKLLQVPPKPAPMLSAPPAIKISDNRRLQLMRAPLITRRASDDRITAQAERRRQA
jgi:hypothetical protein